MDAKRIANSTTTRPPTEDPEASVDNTTTFIIGFGILLIFVLLGVLASVFLCITLKKDAYLWEADRERQLQQKQEMSAKDAGDNKTTRTNEKSLDSTQI